MADFVAVMQLLNLELNGERPSESVGAGVDAIPRGVAYSVSEVSRMVGHASILETGTHRAALLAARAQIESAWSAVLASDIDDIVQHLRDDAAAT